MTIAAAANTVTQVGDGSTTAFPFTFPFFAKADIVVKKVLISTSEETTQVLGVDYTLSEPSKTGGTVTMTTAPSNLYNVKITRAQPLAQTTDLRNQGTFYPEAVEDGLDKIVCQAQDIDAAVDTLDARETTHYNALVAADAAEAVARIAADASIRSDFSASLGGFSDSLTVLAAGSDVARAFNTRFGEVQNVKDFGAVGDGTTDDTANIQQAIDRAALAAGGGIVLVPKGTYKITSQLELKSGVHLVGVGQKSVIRLDTATLNAIAINIAAAVTEWSIEHLRIDCATLNTAGQKLINGASATFGFIRGVVLANATLHAIYLSLCNDVTISDVRIHDIRRASSADGTGIELSQCSRVVIANVFIYRPGLHGIRLDRTGDIVLAGIGIDGFGHNGTGLANTGILFCSCTGSVLTGFRISSVGSGHHAIVLDRTAGECSRNYIGNGYVGSVGHPIRLLSAINNVLENINALVPNASNVIHCAAGTSPAELVDNVVRNIRAEANGGTITSFVHLDGSSVNVRRNRFLGLVAVGAMTNVVASSGAGVSATGANRNRVELDDLGTFDLTYGVTVSTDLKNGKKFFLNVTNGVGFTMQNPTNLQHGDEILYHIKNTSGGAMGAITWDTKFKLSGGAFTTPANGQSRFLRFIYEAAADRLYEVTESSADVPN